MLYNPIKCLAVFVFKLTLYYLVADYSCYELTILAVTLCYSYKENVNITLTV